MEINEQTIYCSLDLELTGFNPTKDEILEVGFVLFRLSAAGLEVVEKWSQVLRPTKEVRPKILALTGIARHELNEAPRFSEIRDTLQQKLQDVVLVGHGIAGDVRFLQAFGVTLANPVIDTLDLVQVFLPTHHSYNLENLMHYLDIPRRQSHRALMDAEVTAELLVRMLGIASSLPRSTQEQIHTLALEAGLTWAHCLGIVPATPLARASVPRQVTSFQGTITIAPKSLIGVRTTEPILDWLTVNLEKPNNPVLLVLPNASQVMQAWHRFGFTPVFYPSDSFSPKLFERMLQNFDKSPGQALFLSKMLVWQEINWQQRSLLDVNLSFSGSQFKPEVTGGELPADLGDVILVTDYKTYALLAKEKLYTTRQVYIESIVGFENFLSTEIGVAISWGNALYALKQIYNPEADIGTKQLSVQVTDALAATDLFFGLVQLLLKKLPKQGAVVPMETIDSFVWDKLARAADNYIMKLSVLEGLVQASLLSEIIVSLKKFFNEDTDLVRWLEVSETRCVLFAKPLLLRDAASELLSSHAAVSFIDSVPDSDVLRFYADRLGVVDHPIRLVDGSTHTPPLHVVPEEVTDQDLVGLVTAKLPAVVVFPTQEELKDFYDAYFVDLQLTSSVFALGYSGGVNKLLRNFQLRKQSILLVTFNFLAALGRGRLPAARLVFRNFQAEPRITHPYYQAQSRVYPGGAAAFESILVRRDLHTVIGSCYSPILEDVYVIYSRTMMEHERIAVQLLDSSGYFS